MGIMNYGDIGSNRYIEKYFSVKALAEATSFLPVDLKVRIAKALYRRASGPVTAHDFWFRSADRYTSSNTWDGTNGGYWELDYDATPGLDLFRDCGGAADGVTDDGPIFRSALKLIEHVGRGFIFLGSHTWLFGGTAKTVDGSSLRAAGFTTTSGLSLVITGNGATVLLDGTAKTSWTALLTSIDAGPTGVLSLDGFTVKYKNKPWFSGAVSNSSAGAWIDVTVDAAPGAPTFSTVEVLHTYNGVGSSEIGIAYDGVGGLQLPISDRGGGVWRIDITGSGIDVASSFPNGRRVVAVNGKYTSHVINVRNGGSIHMGADYIVHDAAGDGHFIMRAESLTCRHKVIPDPDMNYPFSTAAGGNESHGIKRVHFIGAEFAGCGDDNVHANGIPLNVVSKDSSTQITVARTSNSYAGVLGNIVLRPGDHVIIVAADRSLDTDARIVSIDADAGGSGNVQMTLNTAMGGGVNNTYQLIVPVTDLQIKACHFRNGSYHAAMFGAYSYDISGNTADVHMTAAFRQGSTPIYHCYTKHGVIGPNKLRRAPWAFGFEPYSIYIEARNAALPSTRSTSKTVYGDITVAGNDMSEYDNGMILAYGVANLIVKNNSGKNADHSATAYDSFSSGVAMGFKNCGTVVLDGNLFTGAADKPVECQNVTSVVWGKNLGLYPSQGTNAVPVAAPVYASVEALGGRRNAFINANFDVAQGKAGATVYTSAGYTDVDMTYIGGIASGNYTVSLQPFTVGQTDVPDNPAQYMRVAETTPGSSFNGLTFYVEDATTFAWKPVVFSFWAKVPSGTPSYNMDIARNYGSGGSSMDYSVLLRTVTLSTTWQRFQLRGTMPSVSGKTVGAGSNIQLRLLAQSAGASFNVDISGVKLEEGYVATPVNPLARVEAEMLCRRYYEKITVQTINGTKTVFYTPKRVAGTVTTTVGSIANSNLSSSDLTHSAAASAVVTVDARL